MGISDEVRRKAIEKCEKMLEFWESSLRESDGIELKAHQARRLYEITENSNRRVLCADTTGSGKTLVGVLSKGYLDKSMGKTKALLLAPEQAIRTAWTEEEVNSYCRDFGLPEQRVLHVTHGDSLSAARHADIIAMNYHKFGYKSNFRENRYLMTALEGAENLDMVILDEVHNLKNPRANRTRAFREIADRTRDKHLVMLSATPCPNRLEDAGILLYLLDPDNYTFDKFDYNSNPLAFMNARLKGQLFRFSREDLRELYDLPELTEHVQTTGIDEESVQAYFDLWRSGDMHAGEKIMPMRRILIDSKCPAVEELVDDIVRRDKDSQAIIFTYLKSGVTDVLVDRLKRIDPRIAKLDGSVNFAKRVDIADRFSRGDYRTLVATTKTMGEGIPLITHDRPCSIIMLEPPINPRDYDQIIGRVYRKGQEGNVDVYTVITESPELAQLMLESREALEREYYFTFPGTWKPTTIDSDFNNIRIVRQEILEDTINRGSILDDIQSAFMNSGSVEEAAKKGVLTSLPKPNEKFMEGIIEASKKYGKGWKNFRGTAAMRKLHEGYRDGFAGSPAEKHAEMVITLINGLEGVRGEFHDIIDVGSGPACLQRKLERPITSLDISEDTLYDGRASCEEPGVNGLYVAAPMQSMPFRDESFDLVVASNSVMYSAQSWDNGEFRREIEDAILEANRTLRKGGYYVLLLPHKRTMQQDFEQLNNVLRGYGFDPKISDFFVGYHLLGKRKSRISRGAYMVAAEKMNDTHGYQIDPGDFLIYVPKRHAFSGKEVRIRFGPYTPKETDFTETPRIEYVGSSGKTLNEMLLDIRGQNIAWGVTP